jgi:SAM-dependent methyltransferase
MYSENPLKDVGLFVRAFSTNQISRILPALYVKLTNQTGRGSEAVSPDETARYFYSCFEDYFSNIGIPPEDRRSFLSNKKVLEYGPGDTLGVALLMYAHGASSVTCVDRFPLSNDPGKSAGIFRALLRMLKGEAYERAINAFVEKGEPESGLRPELISYQVTSNGLCGEREEYDLIISRAVLEHVNDLEGSIRDLKCALKPSGITVHLVDLKSHGLDRYQQFDFLTWPAVLYSLMYSHKGFPNRWRVDKYLELLQKHGFHIQQISPTGKIEFDKLRMVEKQLAKPFRNIPSEELSWLGFWFVAQHN